MKYYIVIMLVTMITTSNSANAEERWYTQSMVKNGALLFRQNCSVCHGINAEGTPSWREADANGKYPPPPLNGSAHTWHHDIPVLKKVIREGGIRLGGSMPPFKSIVSEKQMNHLIAYFQSKWPDELYKKWANHFNPEKIEK